MTISSDNGQLQNRISLENRAKVDLGALAKGCTGDVLVSRLW